MSHPGSEANSHVMADEKTTMMIGRVMMKSWLIMMQIGSFQNPEIRSHRWSHQVNSICYQSDGNCVSRVGKETI